MDSLKFNFLDNPVAEFDNLRLIGSIKGLTYTQMYGIVLLNLPIEIREKFSGDEVNEEKKNDSFDKDRLEKIKKFLIQRIELIQPKEDYSSIFAKAELKPGEKIADFALRVESYARKISSDIPIAAIGKMVTSKIISCMPDNLSAILKSFDDSTKEIVIRRAQNLLDGQTDSSTVSSIKNISVLENEIAKLREEIKMLKTGDNNINRRPWKECKKCGCYSHFERDCMGTVRCRFCHKRGHVERICPLKNNQKKGINKIGAVNDEVMEPIKVSIRTCQGREFKALIDTGSPKSLIRYHNSSIKFPQSFSSGLFSVCGRELISNGTIEANVFIANSEIPWKFIIIKNLGVDAIIGRDFLFQNKLVIDCFKNSVLESHSVVGSISMLHRDQLIKDFEQIFSKNEYDIGCTNLIQHSIDTADSLPVSTRCRRLPRALRDEAVRKVKELLDAGIIRKSMSGWRSSVTMPLKKNGDRRFAIDYRGLNSVTAYSKYPLPDPEELLERLEGSKIFSTIDLRNAYWQIPMKPEDICKTAFTLGPGLGIYEFVRMPFGLNGAPATCQKLMDLVLGDNENSFCYLDDVVIFSETIEDHEKHVRATLNKLRNAGLKINMRKCKFFEYTIEILGHVVSQQGIKMDPSNRKCIDEIQKPSCVKELKQFLGFAGYFQKFIYNFARIAIPLYNLTEKKKEFIWTDECDKSFNSLKNYLKNLPLLKFPKPNHPLHLYTDASAKAIGACLFQIIDDCALPIYFASRTLNSAEINYSTIDREMLAIVWGIKKLRHHLLGREFFIHTDHSPLTYLSNFRDSHGRRARWLSTLMEYSFRIEHIPGNMNKIADMLSRTCFSILLETNEEIISKIKHETDYKIFVKSLVDDELNSQLTSNEFYLKLWKSRNKISTYNDSLLYFLNRDKVRLIIPESMVNAIANNIHKIDSGHSGVNKSLELAQRNMFWPNMKCTFEQIVSECEICGVNKLNNPNPRHEIHPIPVETRLSDWHVDFIGPLQTTSLGNKYILIFVDRLTKWVEAFPLKEQTAEATANIFVNKIISRFGIPKSIHSDQGRQFESLLFNQTCEILGIRKTRNSPYHPQGNGQAERFVRTLKDKLRNLVQNNDKEWDELIDIALMTIRVTINESTKMSPFELVYGILPKTPNSFEINGISKGKNLHIKADELIESIKQIEEKAKKNIEISQSKYKFYSDLSSNEIGYVPGSWVRIRNINTSSLSPRYGPPVKIIAEQIPGTYLIEKANGQKIIVHHDRLKPHLIDDKYKISRKRNEEANKSKIQDLGGRNVTTIDDN